MGVKHIPPTVESLLARTEEEGDCRLWTGHVASNGQPACRFEGSYQPVRKVLTVLIKGKAPAGKYGTVCNNPLCIEPKHIKHRTQAQHMEHMRSVPHSPARRAAALLARRRWTKLTIEQVREIRQAEGFNYEIAPRFGVSAEMVRRIRNGQAWQEASSPFRQLMR